MNQKKYMDIERLKPSYVQGFEIGDYIVIQEKIDGANFSIRYDEVDDSIKSFSRKRLLDFNNNLRGAWNWSQTLSVELVKSVLGNNLILFGEWLVPHTVKYPKDKYQKAYFYDVFNIETSEYLPQNLVEDIIVKLGLTYVPVFYKGNFTNWEDIYSFVGKTEMGGEYGEGIVVKNQTKLNSSNCKLPFYTKIVCEQFCETKAHKIKNSSPEDIEEKEKQYMLTESIVTEVRVHKMLNKFIDEGLIPENWDEKDMSVIAKNIGKEIYYDCIKEEPEVVEQIGNSFGKLANSTAMKITRNILSANKFAL